MTDQTPVRSLAVAITIAGATFARLGDFSVVMGQRKAGKTTTLQYVIATALMPPDTIGSVDTLQIQAHFCAGKDVVYVDTEGSQEDTKDFIEGVKRILKIDEMPPNFYAYHWRELTQKQCREGMEVLFQYHSNSHLWVIDGVSDLVSKPNDEAESNETVRWLMNNAGRLNACFVVIIHENPAKHGQESKARGHLGSELERKASGAIAIEKDKEKKCHFIKSRFLRKSSDFEPICFWWEGGQPASRTVTADEKRFLVDKDYRKEKELTILRNQCFLGLISQSEQKLKAAVELYQDPRATKEATRKARDRAIKDMLDLSLIRAITDASGKLVYETMFAPVLADETPAPF